MKKTLYVLFSIAIGLALLTGCGNDSLHNAKVTTDWKPTLYENINNVEGITMQVKKGTESSTGLTVIIENHSDKDTIYGKDFLLEKKIKDTWYQVPVELKGNFGFNDIGYDLTPSESSEWTVEWEWLYGKLDPGEYRIVKDISLLRKTGDYTEYHLIANFTIK